MAVSAPPGAIQPVGSPVISPAVPGTTTAAPKTTAAGIKIPVQAPVAGTDPIATPYDADQDLAEKAYQDALASIGVQQQAAYANYGIGPEGELDPWTNQFGQLQQQQRSNADLLTNIDAGLHSRGFFGGGLSGQAEAAGQQQAAQGIQGVANAAIAAQTGYFDQLTGALSDRDLRIQQDKENAANWIQQNQLMSPHAQYRSTADVNALVHKAAADWAKKYGGLGKTNKAGQTFQQRLDMYGQALYDPTKTFRFGGKNYGVAT
jgi:hypothetical protein